VCGFVLVVASMIAGCGSGEHAPRRARGHDSAFAAMQARGRAVMGVDQYTSTHVFEDRPDGGRIVLERDDSADTAAIAAIRRHMRDIAAAFGAGDFTMPFRVHGEPVPGAAALAERRAVIRYTVVDRPRGAELRIETRDPAAVAAVHRFLAYQRTAHHAQGHEAPAGMRVPLSGR
jgi:hypothetical protein